MKNTKSGTKEISEPGRCGFRPPETLVPGSYLVSRRLFEEIWLIDFVNIEFKPIIFRILSSQSSFDEIWKWDRYWVALELPWPTRSILVTSQFVANKRSPRKGQLFFVTVMEGRSKWVFGRGRNCQIRSAEDVKTGRTINSFTKWEIWVSFRLIDSHEPNWTVISIQTSVDE